MTTRHAETTLAIALLLGALGMIVFGARRTHRIYDEESLKYGMLAFTRISERALTIDATFTGVKRENGRLFSTYDRSVKQGKRACPT